MMKLKFFILLFGTLTQLGLYAQHLQVSDLEGNSIPGSVVILIGQPIEQARIADQYGLINLEGIPKGQLLAIQALGFQSDTLLNSGDSISIQLKTKEYGLNEVVITGQYRPVSASESVYGIRVISAADIQKRAAITLKDVLQNELNFSVSQDNVLGAGLSMQGTSGENVKIMIDGVPVIGRLDGNIDLSQINLNNVARIEIIEGPMAVNYGSNALAGTINVITTKPKTNQMSAGGEFYTESTGVYNAIVRASRGWKRQSFQLEAGRNFFDGWNPGDQTFYHQRSYLADETRYQQWKPRTQWYADGKWRNTWKKGYLEFAGNWFDEEIISRGKPRGIYKETAHDDTFKTERYSLSGKIQESLNEHWNMHHLLAFNNYQRTKTTYLTELTGVSSEISADSQAQDTTSFKTALARGSFIGKTGSNWEVQAGYEVEVEWADGKRIEDEIGRIENYAVFATAEWKPLTGLTIKPGLRATYNSRFEAPITPALNLLYQLPKNLQLRASYGRGFRSPGLKELSFYFVDVNHNITGNPNLIAEESNNFQLSIAAVASENRKWDASFSGFYNDIHNLINLAQMGSDPTAFTYINIGQQRSTGAKTTAGWTNSKINLHAGFAYTWVESRVDESIPSVSFRKIPEATFQAGYHWQSIGLQANAIYKWNGRRNYFFIDADDVITETFLESYQNLDLTLRKTLFAEKLSVEIGAKNLFNIQNLSSTNQGSVHSDGGNIAMATGRSYFARLVLNITNQ